MLGGTRTAAAAALTAASTAAVIGLLAAGAAAAAGSTLTATFAVHETVTADNNVPIESVGEQFSADWTFTPSCTVGTSCASSMLSDTGLRLNFTPTSAQTYAGQGTAVVACYRRAAPHSVIVNDGETRTTTAALTVTAASAGAASVFNATIHFTYTPTADGTAHHCAAASAVWSAGGTIIAATLTSTAPVSSTAPVTPTATSTTGSTPAATSSSSPGAAAASAAAGNGGIDERSSFARSLVPISHAFPLNGTTVLDALIAVSVMLLITFPAQLFNKTLDENYDDIRDIVRRRAPPLVALRRRLHRHSPGTPVVAVGAVIVLGSVLGGFNDPGFGVNSHSLRTLAAVLTSFLIGLALAATVNLTYRRARHLNTARTLHALPAGLLVAGGCVLVSRLTGFEPGYLYGVIAGVAFTAPLSTKEKGHEAALSSLATMSLALISWGIWTPIRAAAQHPHPSALLLIADSLFAGLCISGIAGTVINLVPLDFLAGGALVRWHRGVWAATFTVAVFLLVEVMLLPAAHSRERADAPFIVSAGLFAVFGGTSVVFNRVFTARAKAREKESATGPPTTPPASPHSDATPPATPPASNATTPTASGAPATAPGTPPAHEHPAPAGLTSTSPAATGSGQPQPHARPKPPTGPDRET